jgi:hypothetical protein
MNLACGWQRDLATSRCKASHFQGDAHLNVDPASSLIEEARNGGRYLTRACVAEINEHDDEGRVPAVTDEISVSNHAKADDSALDRYEIVLGGKRASCALHLTSSILRCSTGRDNRENPFLFGNRHSL